MPITNPTELLAFLNELDATPKKKLSQNFLIDGNVVRKILTTASVQSGDTVLEIGPGPGALTELLLEQGTRVYAVEKDRVFAKALERFKNVTVFADDIRDFDLSKIPIGTKVIANLPYHLTAPILALLAPRHDLFSELTIMVQEEVARRITASPQTKDYGSLTVFLNLYSDIRYAFKVSRRCFYPQPKVDSAVVTLSLKKTPPIDVEAFVSFVRKAFQHRRKMIKTIFGETVGACLMQLNENPKSRPEDLSLDTFIRIFKKIQ